LAGAVGRLTGAWAGRGKALPRGGFASGGEYLLTFSAVRL